SVPLLITQPIHPVRASKQGAYGVLARAYLTIRDYEKAGLYADSCLQIYSSLLNFNDLDVNAANPIPAYNQETIAFAYAYANLVSPNTAKINTQVYAMYPEDDLRNKVYFMENTDGTQRFKGSFFYSNIFKGITTGEMLLI